MYLSVSRFAVFAVSFFRFNSLYSGCSRDRLFRQETFNGRKNSEEKCFTRFSRIEVANFSSPVYGYRDRDCSGKKRSTEERTLRREYFTRFSRFHVFSSPVSGYRDRDCSDKKRSTEERTLRRECFTRFSRD